MDGETGQLERRTLTPAVLASALFVAASAVFAVMFVAGRGGLDMPVASRGPAAVASPASTAAEPTPAGPTAPIASVEPTLAPASAAPPTLDPADPLLALPGCPGRPGCFTYVAQSDDTVSGVVGRYQLSLMVVLALNPELSDPSVIAEGTTLYLGRDPFVRLEPCPGAPDCSLYVVARGDSLAEIAARYGVGVSSIRDRNPGMARPLVPGQVIELPHPG